MNPATHNVPVETPPETYAQRAEKRRTRRQEKEAKRAYEQLKDKIRSTLRAQLRDLINANVNEFIMALVNGQGLTLRIETADITPAVTLPAHQLITVPEPEKKPLIEVVR